MTDYAKVMDFRHPGREWHITDNDYDTLTILDGGSKPTKKFLDDAWPQVKSQIETEANAKQSVAASARAKLAALGLTEAEVAALFGA